MKNKTLLLLLALGLSLAGRSQLLGTYAGNGTHPPSYGGDGGSALAAELHGPVSVAPDAAGNLFISDKLNNRIRRVDKTTGIITTVAGTGVAGFSGDGGPATAAQINGPGDVCLDYYENILFVDSGNNCIRRIDAITGIITTIAGNGSTGYNGQTVAAINANIGAATGLAANANNIYPSLEAVSRICKITLSTGMLSTIAGTGVAGFSGDSSAAVNAQLNYPVGLAINYTGKLYVADCNNHRIRCIDTATGIITTIAGNGTAGYSGTSVLGTNAALNHPCGLGITLSNELFVADRDNHIIRQVALDNLTIYTVVGGGNAGYSGDRMIAYASCTKLHSPVSVLADYSSNLYIADLENNCVRKVGNERPLIGLTAHVSNNPICAGNTPLAVGSGGEQSIYGATAYSPITFFVNGVYFPSLTTPPLSLPVFQDGDIFTCQVTVTSPYLCGSQTIISNAVVMHVQNVHPAVAITANKPEACVGSPVTFTAATTDGGASPSFQWQVNGHNAGTNDSVFTTTALQNGDQVKCLLKSSEACALAAPPVPSNIIAIRVVPLVTPSISIAAAATTICQGQTSQFTATANNGGTVPTYRWAINGNSAGSNSATFNPAGLTNGDVITCTLVVDTTLACATTYTPVSNSVMLTVLNAAGPSVGIAASDTVFCKGTTVRFTATPQNAGTTPVYQWKLNGSNVGSNNPVYSGNNFSTGDKIGCSITVSGATCNGPSTSNVLTLRVKPLPPVSLTASDTVTPTGGTVQLRGIIGSGIVSYNWSPASQLSGLPTLTPQTLPINSATTFYLQVTNMEGCSNTAAITIRTPLPLLMPSALTPNGDGTNDVFRIPPNAAIVLEDFSVYDRWGRMLFTTKDVAKGWDGRNGGEPAATGVYVYSVSGTAGGKSISLKGTVVLTR